MTRQIYTVNLIYQRNDDAKDSRIMTYNGGVWESEIGPFDVGDVIGYYVSVTDNSGRRERSEDKSLSSQRDLMTNLPNGETRGKVTPIRNIARLSNCMPKEGTMLH